MKCKTIILILVLLFGLKCFAQNHKITIYGKIFDTNKASLMGVSIYTQDRKIYSISNEDGYFEITNLTPMDTISFALIGYSRVVMPVNKISSPVQIILNENIILREVIITPPKPLSSNYSTITMDQLSIYLNPMSDGDALKAITLLPSSTTIDESASPSLRGSKSNRSVVLLNGVPVRNPVKYSDANSVGGFCLFNPEIIKEQIVYASNPPLIYGNSSAGAIEIRTVDRVENNSFQLAAQLAGGGLFFNKKITNKFSAQMFSNFQNSNLFLKLNKLPTVNSFNTYDLGTNLSLTIKENQIFKSYIYGSHDNYITEQNMYSYSDNCIYQNNRYFVVNNYTNINKSGVLTINNLFDIENQFYKFGNLNFNSNTQRFLGGFNYNIDLFNNFSVSSGGTLEINRDKVLGDFPLIYYAMSSNSPHLRINTDGNLKILESYIYSKWQINPRLNFSGGLRTNIPLINQKYYLDKQMSFKYEPFHNHSILLSMGEYHNHSSFDQYKFQYNLYTSKQYSIDYSFENKTILFSTALYHKNEYGRDKLLDDLYTEIDSKNFIYGIELFLQQSLNNFKYSIGYTYLNSKVKINNEIHHNKNDFPYLLKLSLMNINKYFTLSLSFITRKGSYYTDIVGAKYDKETDFFEPIYGKYNSERYNDYSLLSLSTTKSIKIHNNFIVCYLTLNNILNRKNQLKNYYSADYKTTEYYYYSPFICYFGVNYKFY